jgi:hypothetical protein
MSKIVVQIVPKFKTYVISGVSLEVYKDGRVIRDGRDLSKNKPNHEGYIRITIKGKKYLIHRVIFSAWEEDILHDPTIEIDHWKTKSNALSNLRMSTDAENNQNRRAHTDSRTGRKNIYVWYNANRDHWSWHIKIEANGRKHFNKWFRVGSGPIPDPLPPVPQYIIDIRNAELIEYHGEFAHLD